jgi:LPXTG-motif cell wall-anchored protein
MWSGRWIGRSYPTDASPTLARVFAPRHLLAVLAAAALAAPSSALAQGAGDDQYQDPFASSPKTTKSPPAASNQRAQANQPSLTNQPPPTTQSAPSQTQQSTPSAAAAPAQQAAPAAGSQLPYTGTEIPAMALMGLGLLGLGVGLRLRTLDDTLY